MYTWAASFTAAGGVPANYIARWDTNTSNWFALGSGIGGNNGRDVRAIATSGGTVYVGGSFTTAANNPSSYFGIWHIDGVNLAGHVRWAGSTQPNSRQMQPLTLKLCSTAGGSTSTYPSTTDASGYFTVNVASLIPGIYNWREKGPKSLANGGTLTLTGNNQPAEMGVQNGGDANNDNVVGVPDFGILKSTFGTTSDLRADFNNDGLVGILDFNILKSTFGTAGAATNCQ